MYKHGQHSIKAVGRTSDQNSTMAVTRSQVVLSLVYPNNRSDFKFRERD